MKTTHKILEDGTVETTVRVIVHKFSVSDCEDPLIYAAEPLYKWEKSEMGQWVMEYGKDVEWLSQLNHSTYSTDIVIKATLKESDYSFFLLRFK